MPWIELKTDAGDLVQEPIECPYAINVGHEIELAGGEIYEVLDRPMRWRIDGVDEAFEKPLPRWILTVRVKRIGPPPKQPRYATAAAPGQARDDTKAGADGRRK